MQVPKTGEEAKRPSACLFVLLSHRTHAHTQAGREKEGDMLGGEKMLMHICMCMVEKENMRLMSEGARTSQKVKNLPTFVFHPAHGRCHHPFVPINVCHVQKSCLSAIT